MMGFAFDCFVDFFGVVGHDEKGYPLIPLV